VSGSNVPDEQLRDVLRNLAGAEAPEVLARARTRAAARVQQLLEDALVEELLDAVAGARRAAAESDPGPIAKTQVTTVAEAGHPETAAPEDETIGPATETALWAYCILSEPDAPAASDRVEGIEPGTQVEAISDGGLAALVSPVPLSEYGDERLREHLEDLAWVERTARRHEEVLEAALRDATIVPLRLCTLYRTREGVRRLLSENRAALREGLSAVSGCVEWGVKVFSDPTAQVNPSVPAPAEGEGRGATYLLRRQQERALADKATEVRARCVEVVQNRIAALSRASTTNPPQRPEVHGRELTMLLNSAHLIERNRISELRETVASLQEEWSALGFSIELTGPWPPYNFVAGAAGMIT
jgi:hypothetical protein